MSAAIDTRASAGRRLARWATGPARTRHAPLTWAVPGLAFLLLYFASIGAGSWYALTSWNGIDASAGFVGLANFRELFDDPVAGQSIVHTLELTVVAVVVSNALGLALAVSLHRALKLRNVLRSLFFAPAILSPLAVSYIWLYIFDSDGALNSVLGTLGLSSLQHLWLGDPKTALWSIGVVVVWQWTGLCMVIYLAGLQGIPDELDEAAAVDGASTIRRFRRITLPLLAPAMTVAITLSTIFGLRVFDQVLGLTQGGPNDATQTLASQVYVQTYVYGRFGYGSAIAVFMTVLVAVVAITQALLLQKREARL